MKWSKLEKYLIKLKKKALVMNHMPNKQPKFIKNNPNVLEEVINILFYIAEADGNVSQSELDMMQHIAKNFWTK